MTNAQRSESAADTWAIPAIRAKRMARIAVETRASMAHGWQRWSSVPRAMRDMNLSTHDEPLKDATAKAIRLIIAQGGTVTYRGIEFRKAQ